MSIELVIPSNHLILCRPLLLPPSTFLNIRVFPRSQFFASGGQSIGVSASASALFNEYSGLTLFRMDWLDLLAIQETLKSLLQHHSSKASILWHSAFFMVQLSHPYMTTGRKAKTNICSVLKSRNIILLTKVHIAIFFPLVIFRCESGP